MRLVILTALLGLPLLAAACGGDGCDDCAWAFESSQIDGKGTTVVVTRSVEVGPDLEAGPLRLRHVPDAALDDPRWVELPDLDGDGRADAVRLEEALVLVDLDGGPTVEIPVAADAESVRGVDANDDGRDDLAVLRAEGWLDVYVSLDG
jgi:hypothetical protein